jgi:hypothetical protein
VSKTHPIPSYAVCSRCAWAIEPREDPTHAENRKPAAHRTDNTAPRASYILLAETNRRAKRKNFIASATCKKNHQRPIQNKAPTDVDAGTRKYLSTTPNPDLREKKHKQNAKTPCILPLARKKSAHVESSLRRHGSRQWRRRRDRRGEILLTKRDQINACFIAAWGGESAHTGSNIT